MPGVTGCPVCAGVVGGRYPAPPEALPVEAPFFSGFNISSRDFCTSSALARTSWKVFCTVSTGLTSSSFMSSRMLRIVLLFSLMMSFCALGTALNFP